MIGDRRKLEELLQRSIVLINQDLSVSGKERKKEVIKAIHEKYNVPIELITDIMSFRRALSEMDSFILYAISDVINNKIVKNYFTQAEVDVYNNSMYHHESEITDFTFDMIKVDDDQWIGVTDVKTLMMLKRQQKIYYNGDTQRALQHVVRHGNEILQPFLNKNAVKSIRDQYQDNTFIPNTITLNMPDGTEYSYDEKKHILTIYNLDHFDITDGYHRYVAMGSVYDTNEEFNYPVELRITQFTITKAQQFIYQEDQKTKMRRLDSKFMNTMDYGNMIVRRLGEDSNLTGKINNKDGLVSAPYLAEVINKIWKPQSNKDVVEYTKDIRKGLNSFTEENLEYLDKKWSKLEIFVVFFGIYNQLSPYNVKDFVRYISLKNPDIAKGSIVKKSMLDELNKGVRRYV